MIRSQAGSGLERARQSAAMAAKAGRRAQAGRSQTIDSHGDPNRMRAPAAAPGCSVGRTAGPDTPAAQVHACCFDRAPRRREPRRGFCRRVRRARAPRGSCRTEPATVRFDTTASRVPVEPSRHSAAGPHEGAPGSTPMVRRSLRQTQARLSSRLRGARRGKVFRGRGQASQRAESCAVRPAGDRDRAPRKESAPIHARAPRVPVRRREPCAATGWRVADRG